jgi:TPR repeat protein
VCPIALELPVDPVTAEDGRVYNRADIQKHIDNSKRMRGDGATRRVEYEDLTSPMTKEPMGPNLLPAIQVRNSIRALIESGAIEGDEGSAKHWKAVDDFRIAAEGGDPRAMSFMADSFFNEKHGFIKDVAKAYTWFSRAAELDYTPSIGAKGSCLLIGIGTEQNRVEGGTLLGIAADRGDALSQHYLGSLYYLGVKGYRKNFGMAKHWLQKAIAHEGEGALSEDTATQAKQILDFIKEEVEGEN